jgi:hypothetical protein
VSALQYCHCDPLNRNPIGSLCNDNPHLSISKMLIQITVSSCSSSRLRHLQEIARLDCILQSGDDDPLRIRPGHYCLVVENRNTCRHETPFGIRFVASRLVRCYKINKKQSEWAHIAAKQRTKARHVPSGTHVRTKGRNVGSYLIPVGFMPFRHCATTFSVAAM